MCVCVCVSSHPSQFLDFAVFVLLRARLMMAIESPSNESPRSPSQGVQNDAALWSEHELDSDPSGALGDFDVSFVHCLKSFPHICRSDDNLTLFSGFSLVHHSTQDQGNDGCFDIPYYFCCLSFIHLQFVVAWTESCSPEIIYFVLAFEARC